MWQQLNEWYETPLGRHLLAAEQRGLMYILNQMPGDYLLQLAGPECFPLPLSKRRFHWSQIHAERRLARGATHVVADLNALPIINNSFDVILLPHTLEFVSAPYAVLQEAGMALKDGGYLVIFGFNPFSLWGFAQKTYLRNERGPFQGHFWSPRRVKYWLQKTGLTIELQSSFFYRPPLKSERRLDNWFFMEGVGHICWHQLGASFLLVASKKPEASIHTSRKQLVLNMPESADNAKPVSPC